MGKIRPSEDACKKFVTEVFPFILQDLKHKGMLRIEVTDQGERVVYFLDTKANTWVAPSLKRKEVRT